MRRSAAIAGVVVVAAPLLQRAVEISTQLPVGPLRMLTIGVVAIALVPIAKAGLGSAFGRPLPTWLGALSTALVPLLALSHLLACARLGDGPFGPIPGGALRGKVAVGAEPDWSKRRNGRYAELEVGAEHPRSLETIYIVENDSLFVAANTPTGKRWPSEVRAEGRVRIRVGGEAQPVYERRAVFIEDSSHTRQLLASMNEKYGIDASLGGEIWFFRLDPR